MASDSRHKQPSRQRIKQKANDKRSLSQTPKQEPVTRHRKRVPTVFLRLLRCLALQPSQDLRAVLSPNKSRLPLPGQAHCFPSASSEQRHRSPLPTESPAVSSLSLSVSPVASQNAGPQVWAGAGRLGLRLPLPRGPGSAPDTGFDDGCT